MARKRKLRKSKGLHWKYRLRLAIVPFLARLGRLFGISWEKLGDKLGREVLIAQLQTIEHGEVILRAGKPLDVVFLTMLGGHTHNVSVDVVLALALEARGHRVRFVVCDQQLPVCEVKRAGMEQTWPRSCAKCWSFGRKYLTSAGFEILPVSELLCQDRTEPGTWDEIVEASLLKHYKVGVLDDTDQMRQRRDMFARSAAISAAVARALVEMHPDRVIMSHGIYCTWGPPREILNEAGIAVVTYGKGKRSRTQKFNWTTSSDWWDVSAEWQRVKDVPLTDDQETRIDAYLRSRRSHSQDSLVYNLGEEESTQQVRKRLDLDPDKQTFVLFTNVLWDAASAQREIAFKNPIDWVMDTIAWFAEHREKQLVVKIHPAEVVIGTNQPFASLIKARFPELPHNVRVIEPHEKVNSWSIMKVADLGLVHTSTVGMELPLEGIPCAVVSRTHFRGRGFTIDVESRREYFDIIDRWSSSQVDRSRLKALSKHYAYLLFERYQLPFKVLYEAAHLDVRALAFASVDELIHRQTIGIVSKVIEEHGQFLLPGSV